MVSQESKQLKVVYARAAIAINALEGCVWSKVLYHAKPLAQVF
jgi:hypothetical protein